MNPKEKQIIERLQGIEGRLRKLAERKSQKADMVLVPRKTIEDILEKLDRLEKRIDSFSSS